jgi:hypothetical protein
MISAGFKTRSAGLSGLPCLANLKVCATSRGFETSSSDFAIRESMAIDE